MQHETTYVSCNCNQTPTAAHWGSNNLICYASCNSVVIYDPKWGPGGKVLQTLVKHTKRVNSVRWLSNQSDELVSGSTDGTAVVWSPKNGSYTGFVLRGHQSNVNLVDGVTTDTKTIVVSVGMDSQVKIWCRQNSEEFLLQKNINYGYAICVGLRIALLPHSEIILACAMDNSKIDLYSEDDFNLAATLSGHEDWVRGLDFTTEQNDVLLASCSQDSYIRLWRFTPQNELNDNETYVKTKSVIYRVSTDSVLTGHEGWIYSVNWSLNCPQLLSASLDKTMIIWELDSDSNLWVEKIRVGEVGGNTLGFYGGCFNPKGDSILSHSYHGAFHIWTNDNEKWEPCVTVGGHFASVTDLAWEPKGEFLISLSTDQTTRIHAPWTKSKQTTWHEIARPQIHGYDLSSIAMISRYKFASSAEEKVIRTFVAPLNFIENFSRICEVDTKIEQERAPKGASVPSLGLSNKAVFTNEIIGDEDSHFTAVTLDAPPTEETLLQNTLWPEIQKLYGHGYEVYALAASPDGAFLASACKATSLEHAAILIWDTNSWQQIQKLSSHTLTVAQLCFSPNSDYLLSVSRDRRWSLFKRNADKFELVATTDKKTSIHTRIIWCCAWSPDSRFFATGSRDGKVVVWTRNEQKKSVDVLGQYECASQHLELKPESVTALAFAPSQIENCYIVAVGLETGMISCYKWSTTSGWDVLVSLEQNLAHHLTVRRLSFRPQSSNVFVLASCGNDNALKLHTLAIK